MGIVPKKAVLMLKLFAIILISSFSVLSFANDKCSNILVTSQNILDSTRVISDFLKIPVNVTAVRLTGSFSNPPADISIKGNDVVVQTTEDGKLEISVRTANFVGEDTELGNGQIIPRSGSSIEIQVSQGASVNIQGDSLVLQALDGKQLTITRARVNKHHGPFMFLVKITDNTNELSAYVMSAF